MGSVAADYIRPEAVDLHQQLVEGEIVDDEPPPQVDSRRDPAVSFVEAAHLDRDRLPAGDLPFAVAEPPAHRAPHEEGVAVDRLAQNFVDEVRRPPCSPRTSRERRQTWLAVQCPVTLAQDTRTDSTGNSGAKDLPPPEVVGETIPLSFMDHRDPSGAKRGRRRSAPGPPLGRPET